MEWWNKGGQGKRVKEAARVTAMQEERRARKEVENMKYKE